MENMNTKEIWNRYHTVHTSLNYPEKFKFISRELLSLPDNSKILEIGCGRGLLLEQIKLDHPTFILKGIDFSKKAIEEVRKRGIPAKVGTLPSCLKKCETEWDAIVGTELLEHLEEDKRLETIQNIYKILAHKGKAIFSVPDNVLPHSEEALHLVCYTQKTFKDFLSMVFPVTGVVSREFLVSDIPHPDPKRQWGNCPFLFGTGYKL